MVKKASIVCRTCSWTGYGVVPEGEPTWFHYELESTLKNLIQKHHNETRQSSGFWGHRNFDVFLENGSTGTIEGNSYCVFYKKDEVDRIEGAGKGEAKF